jgi:hypothetical protein
MARTLFPHHRHINFDDSLYAALTQAALWRRVSLAAYVRGAVEVATRAEYLVRGVKFPPDHVEVLPGQAALPGLGLPDDLSGPVEVGTGPIPVPGPQRIADPDDVAAVRGFMDLGRELAAKARLTEAALQGEQPDA